MSRLHPASGQMRVPLHIWGRAPPDDAIRLLERLAAEPYVCEHIAAMPDLHLARNVAVGTVFATERHIVPSALGGDLGCGVTAVPFDLPAAALDRRALERVLAEWTARIPVGDAAHRGKGLPLPDAVRSGPLSTRALERERERLGPRHLGTLGGGNHFVELDRDSTGGLWLLVHSGSRGLGGAVGHHHARVADAVGVGALKALEADSPEGQACAGDLAWALTFARANRDALLSAAIDAVVAHSRAEPDLAGRLDLHHNFVQQELHFGRRLWIHRKGAIAAPEGAKALIPGSMGTASYVVEGLGQPLAFGSASHGAGRVLTRTQARAEISRDRLRHQLRRVVHDVERERSLVEEAPDAYRQIAEVLEDEVDLVRPLLRLEPIAVLKG